MAGVVIECLPYQDLIARYDRPETLFYLDPPYHGGENDYGKGLFDRSDYARMAGQLARIQGRFILSINDVPQIREIFADFRVEAVTTSYSVARRGNKPAGELIVSNC